MKNFKEIRENVRTADKKPQIYTKPDGKKGTRMVPVDREVIKQEKTLEWLKSALAREAKATKPRQDDMEEQTEDVSELTIADVQKATAMAKKRQEKERKAGKKSVSTADLAARMPKKESLCPKCKGEGCDHCDGKGYHMTEAHDPKHVKQAVGIASDPRYKGGNMTGATKTINKLSKGLSDHPQVKAVLKRQNEGLKTFAEISKGMASRYIKKAQVSTADAAKSTERGYADSRSPDRDIAKAGSNQAKKGIKTFVNRNKGTSTAVDKLTGKAKVPAKEETVDEISNAKMGQYVRKAADDAARKGSKGDVVGARRRVKGVSKAMDKMDKNRLYGRQ